MMKAIIPLCLLISNLAFAHYQGLSIWDGYPANKEADYIVAYVVEDTNQRCTATRVSHDYFITAAHCFKGSSSNRLQIYYYGLDKNIDEMTAEISIQIYPLYSGSTGKDDLALFKILSLKEPKDIEREKLLNQINYYSIFDQAVGIARISYEKISRFKPIWLTGSGRTQPSNLPRLTRQLYTWGINETSKFSNGGNSFYSTKVIGFPFHSSLPGDSGGGVWDKEGNLIGVISGTQAKLREIFGEYSFYWKYNIFLGRDEEATISATLAGYKTWLEPIIEENKSNPILIESYKLVKNKEKITANRERCLNIHDYRDEWTCFNRAIERVNFEPSQILPIDPDKLWDQGYANYTGYLNENTWHDSDEYKTIKDQHDEFKFRTGPRVMSMLMKVCYEESSDCDCDLEDKPGCFVAQANGMMLTSKVKELCFRVNCTHGTDWHFDAEYRQKEPNDKTPEYYNSITKLDIENAFIKVCASGTQDIVDFVDDLVKDGEIYSRDKAHTIQAGNLFSDAPQIKQAEDSVKKTRKKFIRRLLRIIL